MLNTFQNFQKQAGGKIKAIKPSGTFQPNSFTSPDPVKYDLSHDPPTKDATLSFLVKNYVNQRGRI